MERFLEVCLLLLLYDEIGYGYGLMDQLAGYGFSGEDLNIGTVYRTLRTMERDGWVESSWEEGNQGPKRRVYAITGPGKGELDRWIRVLKARKARIGSLVDAYDRKVPVSHQDDRNQQGRDDGDNHNNL